MNPTSCFLGSWLAWNPVFLFAGTLLFDVKIRQSAALFSLDYGMLEFFTHEL
jgi:hypothetical protein